GAKGVAANLVDDNGKAPFPEQLLLEKGGLKIGVTGFIADDAVISGHKVLPAAEKLPNIARKMQGELKVVLLQDPGLEEDAQKAGFDIVITAPQVEGKSVGFGEWNLATREWGEKADFELEPKWDRKNRF